MNLLKVGESYIFVQYLCDRHQNVIWIQNLSNSKWECYPSDWDLQFICWYCVCFTCCLFWWALLLSY